MEGDSYCSLMSHQMTSYLSLYVPATQNDCGSVEAPRLLSALSYSPTSPLTGYFYSAFKLRLRCCSHQETFSVLPPSSTPPKTGGRVPLQYFPHDSSYYNNVTLYCNSLPQDHQFHKQAPGQSHLQSVACQRYSSDL